MIYRHHSRRSRKGFTLIEVLVATAVTLLMMISLAKIFKIIGDSMQEGRATLELNNRLRNVALRIQHDLRNATQMTRPPAQSSQGLGYFKYYDGPLTDYTAAQYSASDVAMPDASRFGDTDDILMFTARADDVWYTGKVPLWILRGKNLSDPNVVIAADDLNMVTIASQYAEISLFCQPVVSLESNPSQSPAPLIANPSNYQRIEGSQLANGVNAYLPAKYRLHYRALLIRPDLNLAGGALGGGVVNGLPWLLASTPNDPPRIAVGNQQFQLPSPTCDMANAHQQCDLSIRRVGPAGALIAANSLEDLTNPANRFAHIQIPLTGSGGTIQTWSMPVLALGLKLNLPMTIAEPGTIGIADVNSPQPLDFQSGFLHPAFTLNSLGRAGEDVLAADVLAFDVKGFDPGAPVLASGGPDGAPGISGVDDNGINGNDDAGEIGWDGTDDAILNPGDPGYAAALAAGAITASTGEYVDLGWGRKTRIHAAEPPFSVSLPVGANTYSPLSGMSLTNLASAAFATDALYRSGQAIQLGSNANSFRIYQPSYDTWTDAYEHDGLLQAETGVANRRGVVQVAILGTAGPTLLQPQIRGTPGNYIIDIGTDGLDNNSASGTDDGFEKETSAPFPVELSGIKVTIRMEDPATRIVKQMSVGKEFETTQ